VQLLLIKMFSAFYQATLRAHLSETQYLTLQLLLLLLQAYRQVKLSLFASVFPCRFSIIVENATYNDF
jgi:hypothetical protein